MDEKFIKQIKKKLEEEKKKLTRDLSSFAKKDPSRKGNWLTRFPMFNWTRSQKDEDAEEREEYENRLPVEHNLEERLREVDLALEKIKKGRYGKCEKCKKEIEKQRLEIVPEAKYCLDCSKKP